MAEFTWPTTEELLARADSKLAEQRTYLSRCRELASFKLPAAMFNMIPESVWRAPVWGHKLLVIHAPPVQKQGLLHVPEIKQSTTNYGWVVVPGPDVCNAEGRQAPTGSAVCPYGDPLLLVGEFVLFQLHAVRELTFNISQGGYGRAMPGARISLLMIGDIWFPVIDMKEDDWAPEQSGLVLPG
jgi:hypothetical protein